MPAQSLISSLAQVTTRIRDCASLDGVGEAALFAIKPLGYHAIAAVKVGATPGDAQVIYSNAPADALANYRAKRFIAQDPLVQRGARLQAPASGRMIRHLRLSHDEQTVLKFIQDNHGCNDALVVPVRQNNTPAGVVTFGGQDPDMSELVRAALAILGCIVFDRALELAKDQTNPGYSGLLTAREKEVLFWVARGKTDPEVGIILSITARTARFHINNVKTKLNTASRVQMVAKAMQMGLVAA